MNESMKVENIERYFQEIGKSAEQNVVYGYIDPKFSQYMLWGAFASFKMKNYLIAFYPDEIVFVGITVMGKLSDEHFSIPRNEMESMTVKKGLIQYKIVIKADGKKLPLKCNKKILGAPWQKEHIAFLESVDWYQ